MAPKTKSVFRQPGAQHFQLVHRSQRDPLSYDPEASTHVLKPIFKGKSRTELEDLISPEDLAHDLERANIGEAALHGIYYDDTEYDYMQHLRKVGEVEEGVEAVFIEAPVPKNNKKGKGRANEPIELKSLPDEVLPSKSELSRDDVLSSQHAIPEEFRGLQPDMDPHLRQTMEALDDDAFVDDALDDNFFADLVGEGEVSEGEDGPHFDFSEYGVEDSAGSFQDDESAESNAEEGWEARFARFKREHEFKMKESKETDIASDIRSEGGDTIGKLPTISVIGGKKRRKGASDASGYSMSSSTMFRNEGLTLLDERFDEVERTYDSEEEDEPTDDDDDEAPELITSREDFNAIMDDFLDNYEVFGGKMHPVLPGESTADKLGTIRKSLKEIGHDPFAQLEEDEDTDDTLEDLVEDKKDRWDCETILSTYSNLENHPRLIRARDTSKPSKIKLNPKTGIPTAAQDENGQAERRGPDASDSGEKPTRLTVARSKEETKDEKRARKQAVKEERQSRRASKKANQDAFAHEKKQALQNIKNAKKGVRSL